MIPNDNETSKGEQGKGPCSPLNNLLFNNIFDN